MRKISLERLESLTKDNHSEVIREVGGIAGRVRAGVKGVTVTFRYEVWLDGKKRDFSLGSWPKKSLNEIRVKRNHMQLLIADGIDPNDTKYPNNLKQQKVIKKTIQRLERQRIKEITVVNLFDAWISDGVARQHDNKELKRLFSKDILPEIGHISLRELNDKSILMALRKMLARGIRRQVVIAYNDINQMLTWGEKRQPWRSSLKNGNPCHLIDIKNLLPIDYEEERTRVLTATEIRELHDIFQTKEVAWNNALSKRNLSRPFEKKSQIALWLCLGTICRIGELLQAKWKHIDLDTGVWFIPRENVKGVRYKKQEHYVFLSNFTYRQFAALKEITGRSEWCFPSRNNKSVRKHVCLKSISKQVGDRQIQFKNRSTPCTGRAFNNDLVLAGGSNGEWTPHDLRRTGATMMQALGVNLNVIDRCQNHILGGSRVRRHYLHYDYRQEKTEAWHKLGDYLEAILADSLNDKK